MYRFKNHILNFLILGSFLAIPLTPNLFAAESQSSKNDQIAERSKKGYRDGLKYRGYQRNSRDRYDRYDRHDRYDRYYDRYDRTFDRYARYNAGGYGLGLGGAGAGLYSGIYDYPYYYNRANYSPYPYKSNIYVYPDYSTYIDNYYYVYPTDALYYYTPDTIYYYEEL